jgi:asparagine synthase (glutamine-hydrolysing)
MDRFTRGTPVERVLEGGEITVLPLEEAWGLPAVHGWLASEAQVGEFSMLSREGSAVWATRDSAGTRPLYVARSGKWVASDHRFFPKEAADLLGPGSTYIIGSGEVRQPQRPRSRYKGGFEEAGAKLASILSGAVRERVTGTRRVGVAFSGGLDSSVLVACAMKSTSVVACSVSSIGSRDSASAPRAAELLGVELLRDTVDSKKVRAELARMDLPFSPSSMDMGLWSIYSLAGRLAAEGGCDLIILGQLADELFGGYMKYQRALGLRGPVEAESLMLQDVRECGRRGFIRDESACSRWLEPRFPFADSRVMELGLAMPLNFKIRRGERKAVLREAAKCLGVPAELCSAPKKAAQYSSGVSKLLT